MNKSFFTTNIGLKIASLIIAVTLWFFVILSGRSEIALNIPVTYINIPSNLDIVEAPKELTITVEGQQRLLKGLKRNEIKAVIDLKGVKAGKAFFTVSKDDIEVPNIFIVTGIDPETISVKLDDRLKKTVTVKPAVFGLPEKGFMIAEIKVSPDTVEIEGPKSVISKIYTIKTEPIDINGISSDLKFRANLNLSDSSIRRNTNKVDVLILVNKIQQGE